MIPVRSIFFATATGLAGLAPCAQSVPSTINYQGRLTDNTPAQTPINATVGMRFEIWDDPAAGTVLWQEPNPLLTPSLPVPVSNGIFNVLLGGNGVPLPASLFSGGASRYLQITANGEALTPRQAISATGYANQAENAALAANATLAASATDSSQLGGIAAAGYQLATVQSCAGQSFIKTIANGSATCALPPANNLTAPVTIGGPLASPTAVLSAGNSASGPGISASSTGGIGISVTAGGSDGVLAVSTAAGGNGLHGIANNGGSAYGVWGESSGGYAGYFSGNVAVTGKAFSAATTNGDAGTTLATKDYVDSGAGVPNPLLLSSPQAGITVISGISTNIGQPGVGVYGRAAGAGYGVYGSNNGFSGYGVFGQHTAASGSGYGMFGTSASPAGFGGYFDNTGGGTALYSSGLLDVVSSTNSAGNNTAHFRANGLIGTKFDSHIHFGATGDWYIRSALAAGKVIMQDTGGQVTIGTSAPAAGNVLTVQGAVSLGAANFGSATRQQLNLWGAPDGNNTAAYGIGIQAATQYYRASPGGGFAWFQGGTHSDAQNDPGAGGTRLMAVDAGGNLSQPQAAAGAVKAMAVISAAGGILRCYNGGLAGGPTSTAPCGITVNIPFAGTYSLDFGFPVNDRFAAVTANSTSKSVAVFYDAVSTRVEVDTANSTNGAGTNTPFTLLIY